MARPLTLRSIVVASVTVGVTTVAGLRSASADIPAPGTAPVRTTATIEWGPLADRLARPVAVRADDTWETLATREAGDPRWAETVRALNGRGERPAPDAPAWVPPRGLAPGATTPWYAAFLDCSKFGRDTDVSRTGFRPLDPAAKALPVFGTVTVALVRQGTLEDATRAAALPRGRPREALAAQGADALIVAAPFEVTTSVPESSPVRRTAHTWRCDGVEGNGLTLVQTDVVSFDAADRPLTAAEAAGAGLRTEVWAGIAAIGVLSLAMLALARRRRRGTAGA